MQLRSFYFIEKHAFKICDKERRTLKHMFLALGLINLYGSVAQSVEQRTENPCVGGSIPS